jgi:pimeloyl-ACP methyl ester carboxylesterase
MLTILTVKLSLDDRELFFEVLAPAEPNAPSDRVPIVVLHGWSGRDGSYLRPALDPLASLRRTLFCDHSPDAQVVQELDALRAHLGHDRVVLLGHGHGGVLAQGYALEQPDAVDRLILCDTLPFPSQDLATLGIPALVIGGRHDPWAKPETTKALFDILPAAELFLFERSGHFPFVSQPEAFFDVVGRWIDDRLPPVEDWSPERPN